MSVFWMLVHKFSHPLSQSNSLAWGFFPQEFFYFIHFFHHVFIATLFFQERLLDKGEYSSKVLISEHNLVQSELFKNGFSLIKNIHSEPEFFLSNSISAMSSFKVFTDFADWDVEVKILILMKSTSEQMDEKTESSILLSH